MRRSVCIFARDVEETLPECIGALNAAGLSAHDQVHILINGCSDDSLTVAKSLAAVDPRINVHELPVGDKANAWNEYVYRFAPEDARTHIFLDGDIKPSDQSIDALDEALVAAPESYAAAALPVTGRSRRAWARRLLVNSYLSGNLYALSETGMEAFKKRNIRLPFGAKGEDGLITYLLLTDLKGGADDSFRSRIIIAEEACFEFDSLNPNLRDLRIYARRLRRYSERHFQKHVLYRLLKTRGVSAMPKVIYELYTPATLRDLRPRLHPINFWVDMATLRRLRRGANAAGATG